MKHRNLVASVLARLKNLSKARNVVFGEGEWGPRETRVNGAFHGVERPR